VFANYDLYLRGRSASFLCGFMWVGFVLIDGSYIDSVDSASEAEGAGLSKAAYKDIKQFLLLQKNIDTSKLH